MVRLHGAISKHGKQEVLRCQRDMLAETVAVARLLWCNFFSVTMVPVNFYRTALSPIKCMASLDEIVVNTS